MLALLGHVYAHTRTNPGCSFLASYIDSQGRAIVFMPVRPWPDQQNINHLHY